MCFLAHEIVTQILPCLFALSIATTLVTTLRGLHVTSRIVFHSRTMTPARVIARIAANLAVAALYITYHLTVNTFVSDGSAWPPPGVASTAEVTRS